MKKDSRKSIYIIFNTLGFNSTQKIGTKFIDICGGTGLYRIFLRRKSTRQITNVIMLNLLQSFTNALINFVGYNKNTGELSQFECKI